MLEQAGRRFLLSQAQLQVGLEVIDELLDGFSVRFLVMHGGLRPFGVGMKPVWLAAFALKIRTLRRLGSRKRNGAQEA